MSPGLEHLLGSVIISRQMNPTPGWPRPPEPRFRMPVRWHLQTPYSFLSLLARRACLAWAGTHRHAVRTNPGGDR